jgi:hypothetical protein
MAAHDIGSLSTLRRGRSTTASSRGQVDNGSGPFTRTCVLVPRLRLQVIGLMGSSKGRPVAPVDYYREEKE